MPIDISRRELFESAAAALGFLGFASFAPAAGTPPGVLTFRHIHLDFHTSPAVTGVGENFNAEEFARVLKEASVNSITIFGKCHHGMSYYPTKVGVRHPHLKADLVGGMIEACHRQGIRVPVYISTGYDQHVWREHAEWRSLDVDGRSYGLRGANGPLKPDLGLLCLNNAGYMDYVCAQAEEILRNYEADGIFYDSYVHYVTGCFGPSCMQEREKLGLDSARPEDRRSHTYLVRKRVMDRLAATVRARKPNAGIYVNGQFGLGQDPQYLRQVVQDYTHLEIESLPGGGWGYSHFEMASRYLRNFELGAQGMTGAFHRGWGDFGTVRNQAALDYECFGMLAQATRCAIGDHLHPDGRLNPRTYERIGRTYRSVAEKEPWCEGATAVTDIAFLYPPSGVARGHESGIGVTRMLTHLHQQFDILDRESGLAGYKVAILADDYPLDAAMRDKLTAFVSSGGALILSHAAGLDEAGKGFALPVGADYEGPWKHESQYIEALAPIRDGVPDMVHEMYETGSAVKTQPGATELARVWGGFFDKDYRRFQVEQTPYYKPTGHAAAVQKGRIVYFAVPIFRAYARHGYPVYRQMVGNALARLLPAPLVKAEVPSTAQVTMTRQRNRHILHVLHYIPERRSPDLDIVEDVIPLHNISVAARLPQRPAKAYLAPQRQDLRFDYQDGYARVTVPVVTGHQMVVFES